MNEAEHHAGLAATPQYRYADRLGDQLFVAGQVPLDSLGGCRTWSVESENRPQRGQFLPDLQPHSQAMGQKDGEKWTAAADLQPTISKSDSLLGHLVGPEDPGAQALQCLRNLERLLAVHGFQATDIRRLVVYVIGDQTSLSATWSAVAGWFGGQVPPATLLGVAALGYVGQLVEIDVTVIKA